MTRMPTIKTKMRKGMAMRPKARRSATLNRRASTLKRPFSHPLPGFRSLNLRFGINDYEHVEMENADLVGSQFSNDAWEARAELAQDPLAGWEGVWGVQLSNRDYAAYGEEAYTPPVTTSAFGLFWVGPTATQTPATGGRPAL